MRDNLITLCPHHHRYLHGCHDDGRPWTIELSGNGDHAFHAHHDPGAVPHAGPGPRIAAAVADARSAWPDRADASASAEAAASGAAHPHPWRDPDGRPGPHAPLEWDGPGHYDLDLAVAVLQQHLDEVLPSDHLTTAA